MKTASRPALNSKTRAASKYPVIQPSKRPKKLKQEELSFELFFQYILALSTIVIVIDRLYRHQVSFRARIGQKGPKIDLLLFAPSLPASRKVPLKIVHRAYP